MSRCARGSRASFRKSSWRELAGHAAGRLQVLRRIEAGLSAHAGRFVVVAVPNITHVFYGRDVGYTVERIVLDEATEDISATKIRQRTALPPRQQR